MSMRSMRWNCDIDGCFNIKCRLKLGIFDDIWPGKIGMSDVDGIVELHGNGLLLEWKRDMELPQGQQIMFKRLTRGRVLTVVCVAGDAETMEVHAVKEFVDGDEGDWKPMDMVGLRTLLAAWRDWAVLHSKI
jgi:hypothetical protein